jgi:hypothetical protein
MFEVMCGYKYCLLVWHNSVSEMCISKTFTTNVEKVLGLISHFKASYSHHLRAGVIHILRN